MQITCRYFAMLRERRGCEHETLEVADGTTVGTLYQQLFPAPSVPVGYAIDARQVRADAVLHDGAEVVFLPPVGGG